MRRVLKIGKDGKPIIPESQLQSSIVDYYVKAGYEVIRFNSGGGKAGSGNWVWYYTWFGRIGNKEHSGVTDLFVFGKGIYFWVEVKRKNGAKRTKQKDFIEAVKENGGNAIFVDSLDKAIAYEVELQRIRREGDVRDTEENQVGVAEPSKKGQRNRSRSGLKGTPDSVKERTRINDSYLLSD